MHLGPLSPRSSTATSLFLAAILIGCEPTALPEGLIAPDQVSVTTQPVFYLSTNVWNERTIPVCWLDSGFETEKAWVRDTLKGQRSWETASSVSFVGWGSCASDAWGIKININQGDGWFTVPIGQVNRTITMDVDLASNTHTQTGSTTPPTASAPDWSTGNNWCGHDSGRLY